jgi:hypothetical protein
MSEIKPRQNIPDAWAERGRCPLCATPGMHVLHPATGADQLQCAACGVAFEVEDGGARLHVCHWPDSLPFLYLLVQDDWMAAGSLRTLIQQATVTPAAPESVSPVTASLPSFPAAPEEQITASAVQSSTNAEQDTSESESKLEPSPEPTSPALNQTAIASHVYKLRALGNSPKEIRTILTRAEKDPKRIRAIFAIIAQMERQEQSRQGRKLFVSLGVVGMIAVVLVAAGIFFQKSVLDQNQPAAGSTPQPTDALNAAVKILKLDTPVVQYGVKPSDGSTGQKVSCPRYPQEAADLFGGVQSDWTSPGGSNGWVMVRKGKPADIYIPKGMKAAYLQLGKGMQLVDVLGPATLKNTYYLAVSCP